MPSKELSTDELDSKQTASAAQFDRQSDRYGKSHILAETQDVALGLQGVSAPAEGTALDVATGGGHTALWLALHPRKQPDLEWYFETAATPEGTRERALQAVAKASEQVRAALQLGNEEGKISWWWPMLALLACKE